MSTHTEYHAFIENKEKDTRFFTGRCFRSYNECKSDAEKDIKRMNEITDKGKYYVKHIEEFEVDDNQPFI